MKQAAPKPGPKNLILDLLRVTPGQELPVSGLVRVGEIFGVTGNALRVALARLNQSGLLESSERGNYRLTKQAAPVSHQVEQWRLGEKRLRPWDGSWLMVWLPRRAASRTARARSLRALTFLGFREGREGLWVRPANLPQKTQSLHTEMISLGLEETAELFRAAEVPGASSAEWKTQLWPARELANHYGEFPEVLEESRKRIKALSHEKALAETFLLGGQAIRLLAGDPLLPEEIYSGEKRRAVTAAMLDYDKLGRSVWARFLQGITLQEAPSNTAGISPAA